MVKLKNEPENLVLSIPKNCRTLIKQTHRKGEETVEFKITKSKETLCFKQPISVKRSWMLGLISLEV